MITNPLHARIQKNYAKRPFNSSQLTAHSSQLTAHSSQLTAHSSQLTAHSSQLTAHSSQLTAHSSQLTAHSSQLTAHSSQLTAHSSQLTAHSSQLTAHARKNSSRPPNTSGLPSIPKNNGLEKAILFYTIYYKSTIQAKHQCRIGSWALFRHENFRSSQLYFPDTKEAAAYLPISAGNYPWKVPWKNN